MKAQKGYKISPAMKALNDEALVNARKLIAEKFADPIDLDALPKLSLELSKKLSSADSQLSGAVQGKLDALKKAVDLMDECSSKLSGMLHIITLRLR
jgi:hypothetical protein